MAKNKFNKKISVLIVFIVVSLIWLVVGAICFMTKFKFNSKDWLNYVYYSIPCFALVIFDLLYTKIVGKSGDSFFKWAGVAIVIAPLVLLMRIIGDVIIIYGYKRRKKQREQFGDPSEYGAKPRRKQKEERETDDRQTDSNALDRAVIRAVNLTRNDKFWGTYGTVVKWDISQTVSFVTGVKVYGTVTYKINHSGPERTPEEYKSDLKDVLEKINGKMFDALENAWDEVTDKYKGFDNYDISVDIKGKFAV